MPRRKLVIEKLHLPPEINRSRSGAPEVDVLTASSATTLDGAGSSKLSMARLALSTPPLEPGVACGSADGKSRNAGSRFDF